MFWRRMLGAVQLLRESRERLGGRLRAGSVSLRRALPVRIPATFRHISLCLPFERLPGEPEPRAENREWEDRNFFDFSNTG